MTIESNSLLRIKKKPSLNSEIFFPQCIAFDIPTEMKPPLMQSIIIGSMLPSTATFQTLQHSLVYSI